MFSPRSPERAKYLLNSCLARASSSAVIRKGRCIELIIPVASSISSTSASATPGVSHWAGVTAAKEFLGPDSKASAHWRAAQGSPSSIRRTRMEPASLR
jgi:hypothetical protein